MRDNSSVVSQLRAESPLGRLGDVPRAEEVRSSARRRAFRSLLVAADVHPLDTGAEMRLVRRNALPQTAQMRLAIPNKSVDRTSARRRGDVTQREPEPLPLHAGDDQADPGPGVEPPVPQLQHGARARAGGSRGRHTGGPDGDRQALEVFPRSTAAATTSAISRKLKGFLSTLKNPSPPMAGLPDMRIHWDDDAGSPERTESVLPGQVQHQEGERLEEPVGGVGASGRVGDELADKVVRWERRRERIHFCVAMI